MGLFKNLKTKLFAGDGYGGGQSFLWNPLNGILGRSKQQLLFEYRNLVYSCVSAIAEDVGKYDPCFYYETAGDVETEIEKHPFDMILESPNPSLSEYELYEATQSLIELTGECFWYVTLGQFSREPKSIDIMRPDRVQLVIDEHNGDITGYVFQRPDGVQIPLEPDEVIHFKMYNPFNKYRGLGTVEAGLLYIDTETETASFQRNFMRNQASPSGVLTFKGSIAKDAFEKVKKVWKDQQAGTVNAGKTLFIRETDVDFTKIGLSIADLDMTALKKITQDEVRGMFRIPKIMLGEVDGTGLGRDVAETAEYIYQKRTIEPKLQRLDDTIAMYCRTVYKDPMLKVGHESMVPQDKTKLVAEIKELTGLIYTQNESRGMLGLDPIAGGDLLYVAFNMTPVGQDIPVEAPKSYGKLKVLTTKAIEAPPIEKTGKQTYLNRLSHLTQIAEEGYRAHFSHQMKLQKNVVIGRLHRLSRDLSEDDVDELGPFPDDDVAAIVGVLTPTLLRAMQEGGTAAISYVGTPNSEYLLENRLRERILGIQSRLVKTFNESTANSIVKQMEQGLAAGENLEQLTARVEDVYGQATGYRAERIARSEANRAIVGATKDAYSQVGVSQVEWVTDGDPCPECAAMEGTIQDVDTSFLSVGDSLDYGDGKTLSIDYADIEGGDLHPNCNCKLVPVMDGEKAFKQLIKVEKVVQVDEGYKELYEEQKAYSEQLELIAGLDGNAEEG